MIESSNQAYETLKRHLKDSEIVVIDMKSHIALGNMGEKVGQRRSTNTIDILQ